MSSADFAKSSRDKGCLLAVYDLSVSPTSYDFLSFLTLAEIERRKGNYRCFNVLFIPAPDTGFWDKEATSHNEKVWRLQNLLVPSCWLWPDCSSVLVLGSRDEARGFLRAARSHIFPIGYRLDSPVREAFQLAHVLAARVCGEPMPSWKAPARARDLVTRWLAPRARGRRVVTITLRETSYYTARNSNIENWIEFASQLDPQRYLVVFLRDTERAFEPIPDTRGSFETFPTASISLPVRAALYEASFLSMMPSHGPINLMFFNPRCHAVICDLLNPNEANSSATVLRSLGLEIGRQAPLLGVTKRFLWQPTTVELLIRAFGEAIELIEAGPEQAAARTTNEAEPPLRLARRLRETGRYAPAERIYLYEATTGTSPTAALCGLSLTALDVPTPNYRLLRRVRTKFFSYRRKMKSAWYFARAARAGFTRWQNKDEGIEIALCLERWRRHSAALAIYRAVLEQDPEEPTAHYRMALNASNKGDPNNAILELTRAVASDPYSGQYHLALAKLLDARGETEIAQGHYSLASACDPSINSRITGRGAN